MRRSGRSSSDGVLLSSISFRDFRNLGNAVWRPGPGGNLLVGPNGAGKTSLLEAVYLLATSRSFRTPRLDECRQRSASSFCLSGQVVGATRTDIGLEWGPHGRRLTVNGSVTSGSVYLETLPVICWSAADLKVIEGGPRHRRRFLDQGVVGLRPATVEILSRYRRCLEQKRELLRQRATGLEAWNGVMAEAAADLIERRAAFTASLQTNLDAIVRDSGLVIPPIDLQYRPSPGLSEMTIDALFGALVAEQARELENGRVLIGPHRDQLVITWDGVEISKIASAGEKKLTGILLCAARGAVLSQAGRQPIVLLDDIDAELDSDRLQAAWNLFLSAPQVVATTCHESVREMLADTRVWGLESGTLAAF